MNNQLKQQQENIQKLLRLVQENPDLPIAPQVDTDCVCGDEYAWWVAEWGKSRIDYICECNRWGGSGISIKSKDFDVLVEEYADEQDAMEEEAKAAVEVYNWQRVILVDILPGCIV